MIMINNKEVHSLEISTACAGTVVYPPGGHFGPRKQINYQLVLLHTGKMELFINEKSYNVPSGHLCLLQPGTQEEFYFAKEQKSWHRWIDVHVVNLSNEMKNKLKLLPFYLPISDSINQLTDLMLSMQQAGHASNSGAMLSLGAAALELFIEETQNQGNGNLLCHPAVLEVKSIIQKKFSEDIRINDLADEVGISTDHLIRLFLKHEGVTPSHFLWKRRLMSGMDLLRNTGLTVSEIAYQSGFKTSQHFARTIKKHTNLTPTEVRIERFGCLLQ
jgi:AraC-like DNA-binding protein